MLQNVSQTSQTPAPAPVVQNQAATPAPAPTVAPSPYSGIPDRVKAGIFKGESGGNYDTLFGHAENGQFAGTKLTNMTVDQAIQFAQPGGAYANWVNGKIGRVATPMGAYQVVGTTLRQAKDQLGLSGNEPMDKATQDKIGAWIYHNQGTGAWAGYQGPADPTQFKAGEQLHVSPNRSGGGSAKSRQYAADNNLGQGANVKFPGMAAMLPGYSPNGMGIEGDQNTALNTTRGRSGGSRGGGGSVGSGKAASPGGGGGARKNSVSAALHPAKSTSHLRSLAPAATLQSLAEMGAAVSHDTEAPTVQPKRKV